MSSTGVSQIDPNNFDPYAHLKLTQNPDGSITRLPFPYYPRISPSPEFDPDNPSPVLTKDIFINQQKTNWVRVYLPHQVTTRAGHPPAKLPLIVYFRGGGFVICSADMLLFNKFCCEIAEEIQAVVVSVEYCQAPEHRLPAAYDDCMEALHWIKTSSDEWLMKYADISKCFLMGTSAGGNIAYHVGLRAISTIDDLVPLKIQGLILHQPFFGGVERTSSEIKLANEMPFPLCEADLMWELALPTGANRDHEYCNPMMAAGSNLLEKMKDRGWKVVVIGCNGDLLVDRQVLLVDMLKEKGIDVFGKFSDGGFHGVEFFDESRAKILYDVIKNSVIA